MKGVVEMLEERASLLDSTGFTYYTWDGIRVLKTTDGEGALRQRQVHGQPPSGIPSVGDMAMIESAAGDAYTPESDQVGTISKVLDSAASVANAYEYDAFGVARSATETFANPYRFAGKSLDADSSLYHFIARQYEPELGRFVSADVLAAGSVYSYCRNRPIVSVDPAGAQVTHDFTGPIPPGFGSDQPNFNVPPRPVPPPSVPTNMGCCARWGHKYEQLGGSLAACMAAQVIPHMAMTPFEEWLYGMFATLPFVETRPLVAWLVGGFLRLGSCAPPIS
jgi:RHS repeat-associated protein